MKFEKPERLLQREIRTTDKMYRRLRRLAKEIGAVFIQDYGHCWFEVEGKRGPKDIEKKRLRLVSRLDDEELGDERGVFSGEPWFEVKIEFGGVSVDRIRNSIEGRDGFRELQISETVAGVTYLWHRKNPNTPIEMRFVPESTHRLTYACETLSEMRLLTSYLCGGLTYHFWDTIEQIRVDHQELEYDW